MPELPEVETLRQGLCPYVEGQTVRDIVIRERRLRWPIPNEIHQLINQPISKLIRRGKYLLFYTLKGTAILHLGMSGSMTIQKLAAPPNKHDHFDLVFSHFYLRYNDPRRFGCLLWTVDDPLSHPLLAKLGIEPLDRKFNSKFLTAHLKNKKSNIKKFIMNSRIIVGVGNIYANESLFLAGIHPLKSAQNLNQREKEHLPIAIKQVLRAAIEQGGTTLKNFLSSDGKPGYFKQKLNVYGRGGLPCIKCKTELKAIRIDNRTTVYCPQCQTID
jgi:formamidopyrimidine-DNA glycosylase